MYELLCATNREVVCSAHYFKFIILQFANHDHNRI